MIANDRQPWSRLRRHLIQIDNLNRIDDWILDLVQERKIEFRVCRYSKGFDESFVSTTCFRKDVQIVDDSRALSDHVKHTSPCAERWTVEFRKVQIDLVFTGLDRE